MTQMDSLKMAADKSKRLSKLTKMQTITDDELNL